MRGAAWGEYRGSSEAEGHAFGENARSCIKCLDMRVLPHHPSRSRSWAARILHLFRTLAQAHRRCKLSLDGWGDGIGALDMQTADATLRGILESLKKQGGREGNPP